MYITEVKHRGLYFSEIVSILEYVTYTLEYGTVCEEIFKFKNSILEVSISTLEVYKKRTFEIILYSSMTLYTRV